MFNDAKRLFKKLGKSKKAKHNSLTTADASSEVAASTSVTIAHMGDLMPTVPTSAAAEVNQAVGFTVSIQIRPSRPKIAYPSSSIRLPRNSLPHYLP
jgi:hypothetical protein